MKTEQGGEEFIESGSLNGIMQYLTQGAGKLEKSLS